MPNSYKLTPFSRALCPGLNTQRQAPSFLIRPRSCHLQHIHCVRNQPREEVGIFDM